MLIQGDKDVMHKVSLLGVDLGWVDLDFIHWKSYAVFSYIVMSTGDESVAT